jgi:hypothetical protein
MVQNQQEIQARLPALENMRVLLEEARTHARAIGGRSLWPAEGREG